MLAEIISTLFFILCISGAIFGTCGYIVGWNRILPQARAVLFSLIAPILNELQVYRGIGPEANRYTVAADEEYIEAFGEFGNQFTAPDAGELIGMKALVKDAKPGSIVFLSFSSVNGVLGVTLYKTTQYMVNDEGWLTSSFGESFILEKGGVYIVKIMCNGVKLGYKKEANGFLPIVTYGPKTAVPAHPFSFIVEPVLKTSA